LYVKFHLADLDRDGRIIRTVFEKQIVPVRDSAGSRCSITTDLPEEENGICGSVKGRTYMVTWVGNCSF
jgi:hypothetical protein